MGFFRSNPVVLVIGGWLLGRYWNLKDLLQVGQGVKPSFGYQPPRCQQRAVFNASYTGNLTDDERRERILPISFGLPEGRFSRAKNLDKINKTRDFAHIIPGKKDTYIYETEDAYYDGYAEAYFGITMKKAGWDCMRHYEIIAAGSIPYFLDIDSLPPLTMYSFPATLVKAAMSLPGVPSKSEVTMQMVNGSQGIRINHDLFDHAKYDSLRNQLIEYSLSHLTWSGVAEYVLSMAQQHFPCLTAPKVLVVTTQECDYQSCVLFGGLYEVLGLEHMSSMFGPKTALFRSEHTPHLYGNGYSYADAYESWNETEQHQLTMKRLEEGFFNMIIFTNSANTRCSQSEYFPTKVSQSQILHRYQRQFNPLVVVVDGSDRWGCHDFFKNDEYKLQYHLHFIRERDEAGPGPDGPLPRPWSGCDDCLSAT